MRPFRRSGTAAGGRSCPERHHRVDLSTDRDGRARLHDRDTSSGQSRRQPFLDVDLAAAAELGDLLGYSAGRYSELAGVGAIASWLRTAPAMAFTRLQHR